MSRVDKSLVYIYIDKFTSQQWKPQMSMDGVTFYKCDICKHMKNQTRTVINPVKQSQYSYMNTLNQHVQ